MKLLAAMLMLALLSPFALAAPPADTRVYAGTITHDLVYRPSASATIYRALYGEPGCHGTGVGIVTVDLAAGSFKLANPDSECIPGFTTLSSGCTEDADLHVRCAFDSATVHIHADIAPDGAFEFVYDDLLFDELITGTLTRVA